MRIRTRETKRSLCETGLISHGVSRVIIPTEIFSARRVRWISDREFAGSSVSSEIPSFEPPNYTRAEWWKSEDGVVAFQNEVLKYLYYRLKY